MELKVKKYYIFDEDEDTHEADDVTSYEESKELLEELRETHPHTGFALAAVIDI